MNLDTIVFRIQEGLRFIDQNYLGININRRNKTPYLVGLQPMFENQVSSEIANWWNNYYPNDFNPIPLGNIKSEFPYYTNDSSKCDLVFNTDDTKDHYEFAIEIKRIQFVGDNGKNNDHGIQKVLSPYIKDRSLFHDIDKLLRSDLGRRRIVLGYGFEYDEQSCIDALNFHPNEKTRIGNIRKVISKNGGTLYLKPMIDMIHQYLEFRNLVNDHQVCNFSDLWTHPCGGKGVVFAWEIKHN
ncbi:MAG: hypothetical protein JNL57_13610 [Bacteroidetes bacterium]|nr:hypothetical protein [Bacteroidota bacterium]